MQSERVRSATELVSDDDAWPILLSAIEGSNGRCVALAPSDDAAECLHALQVTTRSVLGAVAFHSGGLLIDRGWLRLYGSGHGFLPSLAVANSLPGSDGTPPPMLLFGVDVLGGRFAINGGGGALPGSPGEVCFWAPDSLVWQALGVGHSDFVYGMVSRGPEVLYETLRWPGWEDEVAAVRLDQGLMLFPPPCTTEGHDVSSVSRRAVPRAELDAWLDQLATLPEDGHFRVRVEP